ncbi:hypothetical protein BDF21DRAFT_494108 [Thamnidium elegans]|uniref:HCP-like protein n=1 Tax=Thamnidium elegans TaxID=101142 RepID=A0A8H7VTV4_9FUNG|nr:hypothetical protein INT48_003608 [Thamnidium elegans]KAI8078362.1 hypothetical protein BDF21DRAFT_494108 [Thamnidium elegans]
MVTSSIVQRSTNDTIETPPPPPLPPHQIPVQQDSLKHVDQFLDHSHLKPGKDASLLSYSQTIAMYRDSVKRTHNPDLQCDFAVFMIETNKQEFISEAEKILKQLSIKGHAGAQYQLGLLSTTGVTSKKGKPELDKAFSLFVQASKHLHADAALKAGQCYEEGLGCRINGTKAIQFYKKAASQSHPDAMYRIGSAYMNGELGLSKSPKESVKWYGRAAEASSPDALYELANFHISGIPNIVFVDHAYAISLLAQAADMTHAPSAFKLGECYEYSKLNCQPNPALSIHYYTIAAEQGHKEACFALTAWYLVGCVDLLPQSDTKAYLWAKRAADKKLPKAEYTVGYFSEVGIGCQKDPNEALMWYTVAAEHGEPRAVQRLQGKSVNETTEKKKDECIIM